MDWLLENFGKLLPIVLMVIYFLLNKGKKKEEEGDGPETGDAGQDDRVRRIQDEIRRRILERQQGESPQPTAPPPVLVEERPLHGSQTGGFHEEQPKSVATVRPDWAQQEEASRLVLEQQAKLVDSLAQARRMAVTRDADAKVWETEAIRPSTMGRAARRQGGVISPLRRSLLKDLAAPDGLRRAILLREVLGEPVGMRRDPTFQR